VAGYLALDGVDLIDPPALLTAHEARVRLALDEPLRAAWSRGRESIHREHQALLKERAAARTTIAADQQQQHQDRAAEIKAQRTELDQQTETLKLTAREWQAWLDEQLRRTEKQLTILQKDFATLDAAAREVSNEIIHQQRELTSLRLLADFNVQARSAAVLPIQLQHEAIERENQVLRLQAQFDRLAAQASTVSTQARALLAERTAAARRFERATGQLARQDATLRKWNQLLDKAAGRNEPKAAADTNQYRLLNGRLTLVATYFELDTDAERKRLLAGIAAAP
jgi:chromosome segregation ATPase